MKTIHKYRVLALGLSLFSIGAMMTSCSDDKELTLDGEEARLVSEITFKVSETLPLAIGQDSTLVYTVGPETADDMTIVFKSSDESVATVGQDGTIHGVGLGEAVVTATPPIGFGAIASVVVKVVPEIIKATEISVINTTPAGEDGVFYETDELQLKAEILPADHTYSYVTWHSSNAEVASVDENGLVKCLAPGKTVITVTAHDKSGVKGTFELDVKPYIAATAVNITPLTEPVCLSRGAVALNVTYTPANATAGSVEWTSSDESVLTVKRGVVTPTGFGTATVMARCLDNGETVTTQVTVEPGWLIFDAQNKWNGWIPSNNQAADERGDKTWRIYFPDAGSGKWRRDIKVDCSASKPFKLGLGNYPVMAVRINKQKGGNATLDMVETTLGGGGNPNPKDGITLSDGTQLLIYNIGAKYSGADLTSFRVFQIKMADIPNGNVDRNAMYYDIYWIRTFKSEDDAKAFAEQEIANQ